jgi:hypothetical protein
MLSVWVCCFAAFAAEPASAAGVAPALLLLAPLSTSMALMVMLRFENPKPKCGLSSY